MFITELQKIPQLQMVERSRLDQIMDELALSDAGAIDPETVQKVGRLMGAQALYYGSFTTFGKMIRLDGRLVRVETGEVESGGEHTCEINDEKVLKMVGNVSKIISRQIKAQNRKLIADGFYSRGRTAEENNDTDDAIYYYQQALQYYANHELSQRALERLQR